jgi:thiamine-monophosphate kinase
MSKTISEIGEFGLIHCIHKLIQKEGIENPGVSLGIGDDTAAIRPRAGHELLVTCDCLVEGRHYLPDFISSESLGRRAMTANISDIGSMGGLPLYALISLGLRADTPVKSVEDMYRGFLQELNPFEASIIGGNITKVNIENFIDITILGEVQQGKLMLRSSAEAGDVILVTGYPGQAAAGLRLLKRSQSSKDIQNHPLVHAFNTPKHRAREGHAIAQSGYAKAMIDTSDGLLADLGHICEESGVGAELIQAQLPISEALRQVASQMKRDPYDLILSDSDDYELIITCALKNTKNVQSIISKISNIPIAEIGRITHADEKIQLILPDGNKRPVIPSGWNHFKTQGGTSV